MWELDCSGHQLSWQTGQWLGISGPSGCGKTQLLTHIATHHSGRLTHKGENILQRPLRERGFGWAAQGGLLWPGQSVSTMIRALSKLHAYADWEVLAESFGVTDLLPQSTATLSGGERQRVALLAALISAKTLLLLDEPVSALDEGAARKLLQLVYREAQSRQLSAILVSHQWRDIAATCDLCYGWESRQLQSVQQAHHDHSQHHPERATALWPLDEPSSGHSVLINGQAIECGPAPGSCRRLEIHAQDVALALQPPGASTIANTLPVELVSLDAHSPDSVLATLSWQNLELYALITPAAVERLQLQPGMSVYAQFKAHAVRGC